MGCRISPWSTSKAAPHRLVCGPPSYGPLAPGVVNADARRGAIRAPQAGHPSGSEALECAGERVWPGSAVDFGVARLGGRRAAPHGPDPSASSRTHPRLRESQLLRGGAVDARSDLYSLAVLLYELLTGIRPYRWECGLDRTAPTGHSHGRGGKASDSAYLVAQARRSPRGNRGDVDAIPSEHSQRPAERFASVAAWRRTLDVFAGKAVAALPARWTSRLNRFLRRNRTVASVSAAAVVSVAISLAFVLRVLHKAPGPSGLDPWRGRGCSTLGLGQRTGGNNKDAIDVQQHFIAGHHRQLDVFVDAVS